MDFLIWSFASLSEPLSNPRGTFIFNSSKGGQLVKKQKHVNTLCNVLHDLVPFGQLKNEKNTHGGVFF